MKIDRKLNLVWTLDRDAGPAHVHAMPISEATFERYFMQITRAYAAMTGEDGNWFMRMGPRNAARMLRRVSEADGSWEGAEGVERGLMAEVKRLANVLTPSDAGWINTPLQECLDKGFLTPAEASEIENAIVFFIVCWSAIPPREAQKIMEIVVGIFDGDLTPLNVTDYQTFLQTSTTAENTGETVKA